MKRVYFENLDALRFLAAFSVLVFHYFREVNGYFQGISQNALFQKYLGLTDKGRLGVNFFFVLSGFLITNLILNEQHQKGKFNVLRFFQRRILRIWPLYFIIGFIGFILFPLILEGFSSSHNIVYYSLFLTNFNEISLGGNDPANFLTSPWSVAVEEQFYLFWGVIFLLIFNIGKKYLPYLILVMYLGAFAFRYAFWEDEKVIYYHTISVFQDILTGAFIGWSLFEGKKWLEKIKTIPKLGVILIYILGFGFCLGKNIIFKGELVVFERFVLSLFFGFIILDQIRGDHSLIKLGKIKPFNYLGKISYGLYMYHLVVFFLLNILFEAQGWFINMHVFTYFILGVSGTIILAGLSYRFIEAPLLKLKRH
ncbi:MAG: acyltransferase [Crocinitomicaceae bacterium]|nr:acyltransferase [Crocinitomicaceae bacterium]